MQVIILAGGKGTRAYPFTDHMPKPMMPINGKPMLVQIMRLFATQGHQEFILSVGHRKEIILDYFANKSYDWDIKIVDTGGDTDTAGRIYNCRALLKDQFMATYGDGLCDVDVNDIIGFHNGHDGCVTLTSVPLHSQYGTVEYDESGRVIGFIEKPRLKTHWINAGFFVMDKVVFDHWEGGNLEQQVLPAITRQGLLYTYRHDGFFKSMDTQKDQQDLDEMISSGNVGAINLQNGLDHNLEYFDYRDLHE